MLVLELIIVMPCVLFLLDILTQVKIQNTLKKELIYYLIDHGNFSEFIEKNKFTLKDTKYVGYYKNHYIEINGMLNHPENFLTYNNPILFDYFNDGVFSVVFSINGKYVYYWKVINLKDKKD